MVCQGRVKAIVNPGVSMVQLQEMEQSFSDLEAVRLSGVTGRNPIRHVEKNQKHFKEGCTDENSDFINWARP